MQLYNHTRKLFQNGEVDISALKVMLVDGYTFAAGEAAMTNATSDEVAGNGWATGGVPITNAAVTVVKTNESKLAGDDISIAASGGSIGPANGMVVYDSAGSLPLFYFSISPPQTAGVGTPFLITWDAAGIYTIEAP